jgi:hypothetical protein
VLVSTLLMLKITDMVRARTQTSNFSVNAAIVELEVAVSSG